MSKPAEILVFEFLTERCQASATDSVLYPLELHDTIYQPFTKDDGVRVSDAVSSFAPGQGGGAVQEYDAKVVVVCYSRILGTDTTERQAAVQKVFDIQQAVIGEILGDQYLGNRVCDTLVGRSPRGYDSYDGNPYAVALIPLVINPTGGQDADSY